MARKALNRVMAKVVGRVRTYVRQLETESGDADEADQFAYRWLNSVFTKLVREGHAPRPNYTWGVLHGAFLAKSIGVNRVSVIEFGVAGGNGLIALERTAGKIEELLGIGIDVYGFDTGAGLPKPRDYRDLPNLYREATLSMDAQQLTTRLRKAQLLLGLVESTVPRFIDSRPAPVAFIALDLDYYSSTMHAFKLLEADCALLLPRIHCYFDDIMGFTFSEYTGERLAIAEFNAAHDTRKISQLHGLRHFLPASHAQDMWVEMFYLAHIFDHDLYGHPDGLVNVSAHDENLRRLRPSSA